MIWWRPNLIRCACYWKGKKTCSRFWESTNCSETIFMRLVNKTNFISGRYGKFMVLPQEQRRWSFARVVNKQGRCCADLQCDWETSDHRWKCSFKLWTTQKCGASPWTMSFLSTNFFGLFPIYMTLTYQLLCHTIDFCLLSIALIR